MADVVLVDELETASGHRFGLVTLNSEATLNALSLAMIRLIDPALERWARNPSVVGVILQGAGTKALCAGGDLHELYHSMRQAGSGRNAYAEDFFAREYRLDYRIHTYPKPFLCWGHGIVMGGGIGLMAGASHRVATEATRLAMPEISVGLYPDVGGSWFLRRMPGGIGLFLALTGVSLNAADALFAGLADVVIPDAARAEVLSAIGAARWSGHAATDRSALSAILTRYRAATVPESALRTHFDQINEIVGIDDTLAEIVSRLQQAADADPWLAGAVTAFRRGSPTSAALAYELRRRVTYLSLGDVFRLEYDVSLGCAAHPDFAEGIRALLIDRDRKPSWTPATLEEVTPAWIDEHFVVRYTGAHPLADLA